jgi:hypothetical protein
MSTEDVTKILDTGCFSLIEDRQQLRAKICW